MASFRGKWAFLSNFCPCVIRDKQGRIWPTLEHAYVLAKADPTDRNFPQFVALLQACETPAQAKKLGQKIKLRKDWNDIKLDVMKKLLALKFGPDNPELVEKLLATGKEDLVEVNEWGDTFWGICRGKGCNHLGRLLMERRKRLKKEQARKENIHS